MFSGKRSAHAAKRLVGQGERRVQPERSATLAVARRDGIDESKVLLDSLIPSGNPVAVGDLVAERRSQAHLLADGVVHRVERAGNRIRTGVVVDQGGHAAARRLHRADEGAHPNGILLKGLVQPPPKLLQDLRERCRREARHAHPAGEAAVEMGVRINEAGNG